MERCLGSLQQLSFLCRRENGSVAVCSRIYSRLDHGWIAWKTETGHGRLRPMIDTSFVPFLPAVPAVDRDYTAVNYWRLRTGNLRFLSVCRADYQARLEGVATS